MIINKGRTLYPRPRYRREIREFNVTTSWIQYRMRHLPPNTIVRLWIRVLNKYYVGPPSAPIEFKTEEGGEFLPLINLQLTQSICSSLEQFVKSNVPVCKFVFEYLVFVNQNE